MNAKKLQAIGIVLGVALFVATGLLILTGTDRPPPASAPSLRSVSTASTASLRQLSDTFAEVAEHIKPCVVSVHSEKVTKFRQPDWSSPFGDDSPFRWFFQDPRNPRSPQPRERQFRQQGLGSGIVIDRDGDILTNYHVVKDVDEISVTLADKRTFKAEIVGTDPKTDLAVIKIKDKVARDLPAAELGDSDSLRVGDWVLAVGAPFGYEQTVTAGIVSAKGRTNVLEPEMYQDFIQTDAAINPGNSGGPLVDLHGKVIGINTAIATSVGQYAGVGFAIPINMVRDIMPTLIKGGKISRGMLGVIIQDIDDDLAKQFNLPNSQGVLVAQVNKDSAAEKAGIKVGDVILRYNGKKAEGVRQLRNMVAATAPGAKVEIVLLRNGKERTVTAQIGELATEKGEAGTGEEGGENETTSDFGLTVAPLTPDSAKQYGYEKEEGVLVTAVEQGSPAADAGLQVGDLITEVARQKVAGVDEYRDALAKAKGKDSVLMLIKHEGTSRFVIVKLK
jgi:serine protease Do